MLFFLRCSKFLIILLLTSIISNQTVLAHSTLEKTFPAEGQTLPESPSQIGVWFEDPVIVHNESIQLKNNLGEKVSVEKPRRNPTNKTHIYSSIQGDLPAGNYVAEISVVALDGYVIREKFNFTIGSQATQSTEESLTLNRYSPMDGQIVSKSPKRLDFWFNQPAKITAIGVFDDKQQSISLKKSEIDPNDPKHVIVELNTPLDKGTYQVTWYARPNHSENVQPDRMDVFYFAVEEFTAIQQISSGEANRDFWFKSIGLKQLGYWMMITAITILFGCAFFQSVIVRQKELRLNNVLYSLTGLYLVGFMILFISQKAELEALSLVEFTKLTFIWIPILQFLLLLTGIVIKQARLFFFGLVLALMSFITGHAVYPRYGGYLTVFVQFLHLLAASIWTGGLFCFILLPIRELEDTLKKALPRFSQYALASLLLLVATGIFLTNRLVPSFTTESLLKSEWGKAVVIKLFVVLLISLIGYSQRRLVKTVTSKVINKIVNRVRIEIIFVVIALFFASILISSTPKEAEQGIYPSRMAKGDIEVAVTLAPFYPGLNEMTLEFNNKNIKNVIVTMSMAPMYKVTYNAFKVDEGIFKLTGNILHAAGTMEMNVRVKNLDGEEYTFPFKIVTPGESGTK